MRKLKCTSCGGTLGLVTTAEGHLIGRCGSCGSEYVVETQGRHHVVLEHRFPDGRPAGAVLPGPVSRRGALAAGLCVMAIGGGALVLPQFLRGAHRAAPEEGLAVKTVFNVGGEGAGPGLFREYPSYIGIDSLGRAMIQDGGRRFYIFGPDGAFLNQFPSPEDSGAMLAVLPDGSIITDGSRRILRIDPASGEIAGSQPMPEGESYWSNGEGSCVTPDGGLAIYRVAPRSAGDDASLPPSDTLILLDRNLTEQRRLTGLMAQAIAADPMVTSAPRATGIAINGAGTIYIVMRRSEDQDSRDGIFEFNADGRFQRRIATTPKFFPCIVASPDGRIWLSDPWDNMLEEVTPDGIRRVGLAAVGRENGAQIGNIRSIAAYPNGDIAVIGVSAWRFARLSIGTG